MHAWKWYKCKWFQRVRLRVPGELAISRLPVDRPLGRISFFIFFLPFSCWFVCWLLAISGSNQCRGVPMESKLPAAAMTQPSRFGTRNLEIASRRWPGTRAGKFLPVFFSLFLLIRVLTPYNFRVYSVAWSPDGKQIASGSGDSTIKIWDPQSGDCQSTATGHLNG